MSRAAVEVAGLEQRGEERLVRALQVGFLGLDGAVLHARHEAVAHGDYAPSFAPLGKAGLWVLPRDPPGRAPQAAGAAVAGWTQFILFA